MLNLELYGQSFGTKSPFLGSSQLTRTAPVRRQHQRKQVVVYAKEEDVQPKPGFNPFGKEMTDVQQGAQAQGKSFNPFGNMGNFMEAVKKTQQLVQVQAQKVKQELAQATFDGYDEEETVKVVMSGNQEPKSVDITQLAYDQGPEVLSKRIEEAMLDAHAKSVEGMKERMSSLAKELGVPDMPGGLPGF